MLSTIPRRNIDQLFKLPINRPSLTREVQQSDWKPGMAFVPKKQVVENGLTNEIRIISHKFENTISPLIYYWYQSIPHLIYDTINDLGSCWLIGWVPPRFIKWVAMAHERCMEPTSFTFRGVKILIRENHRTFIACRSYPSLSILKRVPELEALNLTPYGKDTLRVNPFETSASRDDEMRNVLPWPTWRNLVMAACRAAAGLAAYFDNRLATAKDFEGLEYPDGCMDISDIADGEEIPLLWDEPEYDLSFPSSGNIFEKAGE